MNLFARKPIDKYRDIVVNQYADDAPVTVQLSRDEMAVALQVYDYGLDGMTADEKAALSRLIAKLKDQIHP